VDDAVAATLRLMDLPAEEPLIVNIGNDREEIRIDNLARKLFAIADFHPDLDIHPPSPGSPERRCPHLDELRRLIGYQPAVDLEKGLRRTYAWYERDQERR
jgi:UDP-glucose 4-epimerase/UDP-glucuronate decarboxylase